MNHDNIDVVDVVTALHDSLGEVAMSARAEDIVSAGRTRRRRRRLVGVAAGAAAVTALGFAVSAGGTAPPTATATDTAGGVHVHTVTFTVDSQPDGTIRVTWDKTRYFDDRDGLQAALRQAGMPVLIRVGEFCAGPQDDTTLNGGIGPGVDQVMKGQTGPGHRAALVFTPSAMPTGKQLFIGYLNASQLAVTHGAPGSVERLISIDTPLTCTTTPPPPTT